MALPCGAYPASDRARTARSIASATPVGAASVRRARGSGPKSTRLSRDSRAVTAPHCIVDTVVLAPDIARTILDGFDKHYRLFRETSARARYRFVRGDWAGVRSAATARIQMYDQRVGEAVAVLRERFPEAVRDESLWPSIKLSYIGLLHEHRQPECAETFF